VRAAVLVERSRLELRDLAEPPPAEGLVLIRVRAVGICGTDLHIFDGSVSVAYPRVLGHEVVGEVVTGTQDSQGPGTRVILDPAIVCGRCERCREGRGNLCPTGWLLGRDRDGGLSELVAVPPTNVHALPDGVSDAAATLIQVLTTCVHAQRMTPVFPGDSVAIVGLGVAGLLHLQLAKMRGAWPVVCVTRSAKKLELARTLGADVTISADASDVAERITDASGGGVDLAIDCVGSVTTLGHAVDAARPGGRVLAFGLIPGTDGQFPFYELYRKELVVTGSRAATAADFPVAIEAVDAGRVVVDALVSRKLPLQEVAKAFDVRATLGDLKIVVEI
jgi:L-iditol 2-dehydrogenase